MAKNDGHEKFEKTSKKYNIYGQNNNRQDFAENEKLAE